MVVRTIRHAAPCLIEGTLIPVVLFTVTVHVLDVMSALWVSMLWTGCALARRFVRGRRLSGVLILSALGVSIKLATVVWLNSPRAFFLQPVFATVAMAAAFGGSAIIRRPLAARLGADLVPLESGAWSRPEVRRGCTQLSVVWCVALAGNAGVTAWLLYNVNIQTFVLVRPFIGSVTTLPAIVTSFVVGARVVRRAGISLRPLSDGVPTPAVLPTLAVAA